MLALAMMFKSVFLDELFNFLGQGFFLVMFLLAIYVQTHCVKH